MLINVDIFELFEKFHMVSCFITVSILY